MIRLFKRNRFTHGTFVELKVSDNIHRHLITDLMMYLTEENIYSMGPYSMGNGGYFAFHRKEDARIIKRYVNNWTREQKEIIKIKKRRVGC